MNRRYTAEQFKEIVYKLRNTYKDVILTTDIIVGFAGETDEEFKTTYEFLKDIKFYKTHIFKYSERKGTKAAEMKEQVSGTKKEERSKILLKLSDENEKEYLNKYIGREVEVLFEEKDNDFYKGHTANYIMIKAKSDTDISNKILAVKTQEISNLELIGKIM